MAAAELDPASGARAALLPLLADGVVVVVFATIGRSTHHENDQVRGISVTAGPFLAGLALGWVLMLGVRRRPPIGVVSAVPVWLVTVVVGMVLRQATGKGTAVAFIVVATIFLGLGLLGWRLIWARRPRRT